MNIGEGLFVELGAPLVNCVSIKLLPSIVHYVIVQRDRASQDVLWAFGVDLGLGGHLEEGFTVDGQEEFVGGQMIVKDNFPLQILILQTQWEYPRF